MTEALDLSTRSLFDLTGSRVAVAGGLGLIGSAVAQSMLQAGAQLVVLDEATNRWAAFVGGLPQNQRAQARFTAANMGEPALAAEAVQAAAETLGGARRLDRLRLSTHPWLGSAPRTGRPGLLAVQRHHAVDGHLRRGH